MAEKILLAKKKIITKNFEKNPTFFKIIAEGGGTFRLHFWNLQKIW